MDAEFSPGSPISYNNSLHLMNGEPICGILGTADDPNELTTLDSESTNLLILHSAARQHPKRFTEDRHVLAETIFTREVDAIRNAVCTNDLDFFSCVFFKIARCISFTILSRKGHFYYDSFYLNY